MTEQVQRGVGIAIGLIAHFILLNVWGAASLRQDEPYLIGFSVLVVVLILLFGNRLFGLDDDDMTNPSELLLQKLERGQLARNIALMIAYAFGAGGVMVLLFY
jgi:hypothetical protein